MKQSPLVHERVFAGDFAEDYARKHQKIAEKFGREMAEKLDLQRRAKAQRLPTQYLAQRPRLGPTQVNFSPGG